MAGPATQRPAQGQAPQLLPHGVPAALHVPAAPTVLSRSRRPARCRRRHGRTVSAQGARFRLEQVPPVRSQLLPLHLPAPPGKSLKSDGSHADVRGKHLSSHFLSVFIEATWVTSLACARLVPRDPASPPGSSCHSSENVLVSSSVS